MAGLCPGLTLAGVAGPEILGPDVFLPVEHEACNFSQTLNLIQSAGRPVRLAFRQLKQRSDARSEYWQTAEATVLLQHHDTRKAGYLQVTPGQSRSHSGPRKRGMRTWSRGGADKSGQSRGVDGSEPASAGEKFVVLTSDRLLLYNNAALALEPEEQQLELTETLLLAEIEIRLVAAPLPVDASEVVDVEQVLAVGAAGRDGTEQIFLAAHNEAQIQLWHKAMLEASCKQGTPLDLTLSEASDKQDGQPEPEPEPEPVAMEETDRYGFAIGGYFSPRTHTQVRAEQEKMDMTNRKSNRRLAQ